MSAAAETSPHIPVLIRPLIAAVSPVSGVWLDGTFGNGGYTRALLAAGAAKVIGVDRDPLAFEMAADWIGDYGDRIETVAGVFSKLDEYGQGLDGVVLDLGVSSMQLDQAARSGSYAVIAAPGQWRRFVRSVLKTKGVKNPVLSYAEIAANEKPLILGSA